MKLAASLLLTVLATTEGAAETCYLAVGPGGQRMFSADGLHWDQHAAWGEPKHDQNDLNVAAFYKGIAFAGGGFFSGRLTATRDGLHWSEGVLPKSSPIFGLETRRHAVRRHAPRTGLCDRRRRDLVAGRRGGNARQDARDPADGGRQWRHRRFGRLWPRDGF
jgi:hypothetical protein